MAWHGEIVLDRPQEPDDPRLVEIGDLTFFGDGSFRIGNRAFKKREPVDYPYQGGHAVRDAGAKRLTITTANGELYVFEFRGSLAGGRWVRWTPQAVDAAGTTTPAAVASRRDAVALWASDLRANLAGAFQWLLLILAGLGLLLSFF
jgi:hypothetical protein